MKDVKLEAGQVWTANLDDEVIFNLFIYEFMDCYYLGEKIEIDTEITYKTLLGLSQFILLKDCFPLNEKTSSYRIYNETEFKYCNLIED